jgi:hypothetical protein
MPKTQKQINLEKLGCIPAGSLVDIEITTPTDSKRVKTEFIGLLNDQYIILNYPSIKRIANAHEYIKDAVMIIIRAVLETGGGQVIAFRQQVSAISSHPHRLIFLNFPQQVQLYSLRSETRIPTLFSANLLIKEKTLEGLIKDISLTGVQFDIDSKEDLSQLKGQECKVVLSKREFNGTVCRVRKRAAGFILGIQLDSSKDEMKGFMKEHLIDLSVLEK